MRARPAASRPGPTRKRHQQPPCSPRRRYYVEYSESGSEVDEAVPPPPPPPPPVEQTMQPAATAWRPTGRVTQPPTEPPVRKTGRTRQSSCYCDLRIHHSGCGRCLPALPSIFFTCTRTRIFHPVAFVLGGSHTIRLFCPTHLFSPHCFYDNLILSSGDPRRTSSSWKSGPQVRRVDHPKLVDIQTRTFDRPPNEGVANVGLSSEVRKAERVTIPKTTPCTHANGRISVDF